MFFIKVAFNHMGTAEASDSSFTMENSASNIRIRIRIRIPWRSPGAEAFRMPSLGLPQSLPRPMTRLFELSWRYFTPDQSYAPSIFRSQSRSKPPNIETLPPRLLFIISHCISQLSSLCFLAPSQSPSEGCGYLRYPSYCRTCPKTQLLCATHQLPPQYLQFHNICARHPSTRIARNQQTCQKNTTATANLPPTPNQLTMTLGPTIHRARTCLAKPSTELPDHNKTTMAVAYHREDRREVIMAEDHNSR